MQRQISLDIFRGLTLAAMLLVNNPGSWSAVYPPLLHAEWHGLTPTDLIFPFFMFIVGAALFHSMKNVPAGTIPWAKIAKRTVLLFAIGVALNEFPFTDPLSEWRVLGVLQRIALCYGIAAVLICVLNRSHLLLVSAVILIGYWLILLLVENPYSLEGNLVQQWDLALLGASHLYQGYGVPFEPEGILSTLPGVVSILAGYFTSEMLAEKPTPQAKIKVLLMWGAGAFIVALLWQIVFPINKPLWSSTYVLITTAFAWFFLAIIVYLCDLKKVSKGMNWMVVYGSNPLFIYALSRIFSKTLSLITWVNESGQTVSLQRVIYDAFNQFLSPINASLLYALLIVAIFYVISAWLYKRKIFIKL